MAQTTKFDPAANRYAEAAFGLATDSGTQDQWREDLASIAELVEHQRAGPYLLSERTSEADKVLMLERSLDISPLAMNLARILLQRGRLHLAPRVAAAYDRMLDQQRGIEHAEVTTAVSLSEAEQRAVAERLKQVTGAQEVRMSSKVDPALIGGMIARIGDRLIDGSTRTRLIQLKRSLAGDTR
ncbi:MAG: ATP synthase F1 subunit delta [Chloroflexi bacterium]|nr:ATP synthase F1 subunit delta [Chloroflexota bacterium]